ncbi:MAG: hypothetical protein AB7I27_06380 [Bacteriovoracaceae bacterium]
MKYFNVIVIFLFALILFGLEPRQFGFDLSGHLGWVPSHTSAQMIKASLKNHFVGYTLRTISKDGLLGYYYFDRYPVFFSAFVKLVLSPFESDLRYWFYFSKVLMNLLFLGMIIYAFRITGYFFKDVFKRWSVIFLSFSSFYFLNYKSMIHFDQPAIFGMVALVDSILSFEVNRKKRLLIFWSIVAPLLGRGYANLFVLALYFIFKLIKNRGQVKEVIRLSLITLLPGTILCTSMLFYNISVEAEIRNVSYKDVSIVQSARSRLGIDKFEGAVEESVDWVPFTTGQFKRLILQLTPHFIGKKYAVYYVTLLFILLIWLYRKKELFPEKSALYFLSFLFCTGFFWLFPMKRLAAFHDYTAMYYWGVSLSFYILLFHRIEKAKIGFLFASALMVLSLFRATGENKARLAEINSIADDFHKIRQVLADRGGEARIYSVNGFRDILPGRPYILGFYFYDKTLAYDEENANYVLSTTKLANWPLLVEGTYLNLYSR